MGTPSWAWIAFGVTVGVLLIVDLFLHRHGRETSTRAAVVWSVIWVSVGLAFTGFVWAVIGADHAKDYIAAYAIEKSLSLDNLFVFLLIFQSVKIAKSDQHTVLLWGIFGALAFRAIFIFLGAAAIERWDWLNYIFGAVLFLAAYRAVREDPRAQKESGLVVWLERHLPVTSEPHGHKFIVRKNGRRVLTSLFVALIAIELTDVMFAIDSVPAALSVTRDRFVIYSSNAFAILGLRALYLAMSGALERLRYLHFGIAGVLALAALKISLNDWVHVPPLISAALVGAIIAASIVASAWHARNARQSPQPRPPQTPRWEEKPRAT